MSQKDGFAAFGGYVFTLGKLEDVLFSVDYFKGSVGEELCEQEKEKR